MNRKHLNKALIVGVAVLWLLIGFKLITVVKGPSKSVTPYKAVSTLLTGDEPDTFSLYLNYRDPFMTLRSSPSIEKTDFKPPSQTTSIAVAQIAQPVTWPSVSFSGTVFSADGFSKLALITIGGKPFLMRPGDVTGGVVLRGLETDSVVLEYMNQVKTLKQVRE